MFTIIADDFTGANDTGIQFIDGDIDPVVLIQPHPPLGKDYLNVPVLIIDTESRHLRAREAYDKVFHTINFLGDRTKDNVVKKIDSTLRGNVGSEIDALMDACGYSEAFVIPAAPENGRIVKDGMCYIHGVRLHLSEFGKDPFAPVDSSFVPNIISQQTKRKVGLITFRTIQASDADFIHALEHERKAGNKIIVFDALEPAHIKRIVHVASSMRAQRLFVGSSGLGKVLAEKKTESVKKSFFITPRVLFAVGSIKQVSSEQVQHLLANERHVRQIDINVETIIRNREEAISTAVAGIMAIDDDSTHILLKTVRESNKNHREDNDEVARSAVKDIGEEVADCIGEIVKHVLLRCNIRTLFATGGDTAFNIVRKLHASSIRLKKEILPGIPLCHLSSPDLSEPIYMITKAGGFGEIDTLEKVIDFLRYSGKVNVGDSYDTTIYP